MTLNEVIFIDSLPKIDLHGMTKEEAILATNDFIKDNQKMQNEIVLIIHGIGKGIVRSAVNEALKKNKNVLEYKSANSNMGCTLVKIKLNI